MSHMHTSHVYQTIPVFLGEVFWAFPARMRIQADSRHAGEIRSLSWLGNALMTP